MGKAFRYLVLGAALGVCLTWLTGDMAVRAESAGGDVVHMKGAYYERVEREIACEAAPHIVLHNQNGTVSVTAWDTLAVSMVAHKRVSPPKSFWSFFGIGGERASTKESMTDALGGIAIVVDATPAQIAIQTRLDKSGMFLDRSVNYELRVPVDATLELHTSNGSIEVVEVKGDLRLESSNGSIATDRTLGAVHAHTSNGAVTCRNTAGPVDLESSNGVVAVDYIGTLPPDAAIACVSSNGSVKLTLPGDAAFSLNAQTSNGRIRNDFPISIVAGDDVKKQMVGDVGGGGATVRLRTSNGSIVVSKS